MVILSKEPVRAEIVGEGETRRLDKETLDDCSTVEVAESFAVIEPFRLEERVC